jgi:hypothetical protein
VVGVRDRRVTSPRPLVLAIPKIASTTYEVEYEITLRDHKATPIRAEVNEPIGGTWRMVRSSYEWTKTAAWAAQFNVPVAAESDAVLKYRVRVTY